MNWERKRYTFRVSPAKAGRASVARGVGQFGGMIVVEILSEIEARAGRWSSIEKTRQTQVQAGEIISPCNPDGPGTIPDHTTNEDDQKGDGLTKA